MALGCKLTTENKKIVNKNEHIYSGGQVTLKCETEKAVDNFVCARVGLCFVGEHSGKDKKSKSECTAQ